MGRIAGWMGVATLSLYLVFFGGSWFGLYATQLRVASIVLALGTLIVWLGLAARRPAWRVRSVLLLPLCLALASIAVSTVVSRYPRQSVEYLGYAILLVGLYLLLVRILASPFLGVRMGWLATALSLVLSIAYLARTAVLWMQYWQAVGHLTIPPLRPAFESLVFGDPASLMTIVLLLYAVGVAASWPSSRRGAIGLGLIGILVIATVILSGSRSGWVGIAVASVIVGILIVRSAGSTASLRSALARSLETGGARLVAAALAIAGIGGAAILAPGVLGRLGAGGEEMRAAYVAAALRIFREAPVLGTGPGTWVIQRIRYTVTPETDYYIPHAHNIYAQTLAELGFVGMLVGIVIGASALVLVRRALRGNDPVRRRWAWAGFFTLLYLGVQQVLDFHANMPSILFAAALPIAFLDATSTEPLIAFRAEFPSHMVRPVAIACVTFVVIACGGLLASERVASIETDAVNSANDGRWAEALGPAREAVRQDPSWAPYQLTLGLAAAYTGDHATAAAAFREAADAGDLPEAWLDLAAEEALLNDNAGAAEALTRAARLGLQRPGVAIAIGDLGQRLGLPDIAQAGYAAALRELPMLAGDPWWKGEASRSAAFDLALETAITVTDPSLQWQLALAAGNLDRARLLASAANVGTAQASALDVIGAWNKDPLALERLLGECGRAPTDTFLVDWCARILAKNGDLAAANRFRVESFLLLDYPYGPFVPRVAAGPIIGRAEQGEIAGFYGAYTYRRFTPWNILDPALVQLRFE